MKRTTVIILIVFLGVVGCIKDKESANWEWDDCPKYVFAPHDASEEIQKQADIVCPRDCEEELKKIIRYHNLPAAPQCYRMEFKHGIYYLGFNGELVKYTVPTKDLTHALPGVMSTLEIEVYEENKEVTP